MYRNLTQTDSKVTMKSQNNTYDLYAVSVDSIETTIKFWARTQSHSRLHR